MFFPASGGAEPCTGSKIEVDAAGMCRLADAAMPSPVPCKLGADVRERRYRQTGCRW